MTNKILIILISLTVILNSGCATIIGGSKYYAHVEVVGHPNAMIFHRGVNIGTGSVFYKVKRRDADKLSFVVREEGCDQQEFSFKYRQFRWWAFVGSIFSWGGSIGAVPVPLGTFVDLACGSFWKPNVFEKGITKENYKNFKYSLNYSGCKSINNFNTTDPSKLDIVLLKNGSIIKGQITEMVPFEFLKLKINDGSIITLQSSEIERISKEE